MILKYREAYIYYPDRDRGVYMNSNIIISILEDIYRDIDGNYFVMDGQTEREEPYIAVYEVIN